MSTTILCQVGRAKSPYYIEDIDLHVSTIEELCYYLQNHLPLVDLSFFNMNLLDWMQEELEVPRLVRQLHRVLTEEPDPQLMDLILPVMQEAGWLDPGEEQAMRRELRAIDAQPAAMRLKRRADMLISYRKYARAIRSYETILKMPQADKLGDAFTGAVCHNMGVAHARLFQMEEAASCMEQAYARLRTGQTLRGYLFCVRAKDGDEAFRKLADRLGVDDAMREELEREMDREVPDDEPHDVDETLRKWVREYHRETDL